MYQLKPQFTLKDEEVTFINSLNNGPMFRPKVDVQDKIDDLYRKLFGNEYKMTILYMKEQVEKWPSGGKVSEHQAKMFLLNWVKDLQTKRELNAVAAADFFFNNLEDRPTFLFILTKAYNRVAIDTPLKRV